MTRHSKRFMWQRTRVPQVWELVGDARLVTAATPLARIDEMLERARRPPAALAEFRGQVRRTHNHDCYKRPKESV